MTWTLLPGTPAQGNDESYQPGTPDQYYDPSTISRLPDGRWGAVSSSGGLVGLASSDAWANGLGLVEGTNKAETLSIYGDMRSRQGSGLSAITDTLSSGLSALREASPGISLIAGVGGLANLVGAAAAANVGLADTATSVLGAEGGMFGTPAALGSEASIFGAPTTADASLNSLYQLADTPPIDLNTNPWVDAPPSVTQNLSGPAVPTSTTYPLTPTGTTPNPLTSLPPGTSTIAQQALNQGGDSAPSALTAAQQTAAENLSYGLDEAGNPIMNDPGVMQQLADKLGIPVKNLLSLGATAVGALLGGTSASPKPAGTTTTTQDIPDWLKPYVIGNLNSAREAMTANPQDNSLLAPATAQLKSTIAGDYLNSNPYIDRTFQMAANPVVANIDSQFSKAGRYGSGAMAATLGTTLGNLATNIYGGNYNNERVRQMAASTAAPGFTTEAGAAPFSAFNTFGNLYKGLGVNSTTSPYFSNPAGGALSGALAGYGLSKAFSS